MKNKTYQHNRKSNIVNKETNKKNLEKAIDLNIRTKMLTLLREKLKDYTCDFGLNIF